MARLSRQLLEDEQVLLSSRPHLVRLARPLLWLAGAVGVALGVAAFREQLGISPQLASWGAGGLAGLAALRFLWAVFKWTRTEVLLSSKRLIGVAGGLSSPSWSVPLRDIAYVHCNRSLSGKLLGYGDVFVRSPENVYRLDGIARARALERTMAEARKHAERRPPPPPARETGRGETRVYTPPGGASGRPPASPVAGPGAAVRGRSLGGRYRIQDKIDAGGMGTVYVALDDLLGRPVALKPMREELVAEPQFVERFRREARSAAMLSHPNIAAIYDYGEGAEGQYIVMELLEGRDLARVLQEDGRLEMQLAVTVTHQILSALEHAHSKGVIHRDVKPANVVVTEGARVKVTDFGIAHAVGATRLTATGALLGSAHYVAPERVKGEPATAASDIYSLGIVLYEMLVGRPPFAGRSMFEVLQSPAKRAVPVPSQVLSSLSPALDDVVVRATARDPRDRFATASEMKRALSSREIPAEPGPRGEARWEDPWVPDDTPPLQESV